VSVLALFSDGDTRSGTNVVVELAALVPNDKFEEGLAIENADGTSLSGRPIAGASPAADPAAAIIWGLRGRDAELARLPFPEC
jgi:hypothetical protein